MNIIGYSGLNDSQAFKRAEYPEIGKAHQRICQGFDAAAAIMRDDDIVAAVAQERFSRRKATEKFPVDAIRYCLAQAGIKAQDLDFIAHGFDYRPYQKYYQDSPVTVRQYEQVYSRERQLAQLAEVLPEVTNWDERLVQVPHHLAHAASTYYPSGFSEALVLVADGMGEHEGLTVARGSGNQIEILKQIPSVNSLGILYSVFTMYLGFEFNMDEYKVMGLAPYGNPRRHFKKVMDLVTLHEDGTHTIPILFRNETELERETYSGSIDVLVEMFGPVREPESEITQHHQDIAAALQVCLQTTLLHLLRTYRDKTGATRLAMAGGVALNCTANGVIKRSGLFKDMFVQPAAGDDGSALGAALYCRHANASGAQAQRMPVPYLGPGIEDERIEAALTGHGDLTIHEFDDEQALLNETARRLADGQVIGWCQGRMEFGPRALGARSILADPRDPQMRSRVNSLVKKREDFRPFAPAVIDSVASQYFEIDEDDTSLYEYMLCVTNVRPKYREDLPAITHVDSSARVQVVSEKTNGRFWRLLKAFGQQTECPILMNTSFNVRGQPIVCNESEAIQTFVDASLDALVINDRLIER